MMGNPLRSDADYELYIYSIAESFPLVERTTLTFVRQGAGLRELRVSCTALMAIESLCANESYTTGCLQKSTGTVMKFGVDRRNCTGTIHSPTRTNQSYRVHIRITNTCRRISNTIEFRRLK